MKFVEIIETGINVEKGEILKVLSKGNNYYILDICGTEQVVSSNLVKKVNKLPEYYVIKRDLNNPLWQEYIDWLNKKYKRDWSGGYYDYYGYEGGGICGGTNTHDNISKFLNNPKLISLEFWKYCEEKEMTKEEKKIIGYKLKEECEKYRDAALKIVDNKSDYLSKSTSSKYIAINSVNVSALKKAGVLDLWFEPVYKEEEYKVGDWVTIIGNISDGWLTKTNCRTFKITRSPRDYVDGKYFGISGSGYSNCGLYTKFRKATLEEIKAAQTLQITTSEGTYTGEFFEHYIKFGCAKISSQIFIDLSDMFEKHRTTESPSQEVNRAIESVTIGKGAFTKEQIEQIAEYYRNKNK